MGKFHTLAVAMLLAVVPAVGLAQTAGTTSAGTVTAESATTETVTTASGSSETTSSVTKGGTVRDLTNKTCPVMNEEIAAEDKIFVVHKGYKIGLCCKACVKKFKKDPDKYLEQVLKETGEKKS